MPHHWRPSDGLVAGPRPGGHWFLYDRGHFVGLIEHGRVGEAFHRGPDAADDCGDVEGTLGGSGLKGAGHGGGR